MSLLYLYFVIVSFIYVCTFSVSVCLYKKKLQLISSFDHRCTQLFFSISVLVFLFFFILFAQRVCTSVQLKTESAAACRCIPDEVCQQPYPHDIRILYIVLALRTTLLLCQVSFSIYSCTFCRFSLLTRVSISSVYTPFYLLLHIACPYNSSSCHSMIRSLLLSL